MSRRVRRRAIVVGRSSSGDRRRAIVVDLDINNNSVPNVIQHVLVVQSHAADDCQEVEPPHHLRKPPGRKVPRLVVVGKVPEPGHPHIRGDEHPDCVVDFPRLVVVVQQEEHLHPPLPLLRLLPVDEAGCAALRRRVGRRHDGQYQEDGQEYVPNVLFWAGVDDGRPIGDVQPEDDDAHLDGMPQVLPVARECLVIERNHLEETILKESAASWLCRHPRTPRRGAHAPGVCFLVDEHVELRAVLVLFIRLSIPPAQHLGVQPEHHEEEEDKQAARLRACSSERATVSACELVLSVRSDCSTGKERGGERREEREEQEAQGGIFGGIRVCQTDVPGKG